MRVWTDRLASPTHKHGYAYTKDLKTSFDKYLKITIMRQHYVLRHHQLRVPQRLHHRLQHRARGPCQPASGAATWSWRTRQRPIVSVAKVWIQSSTLFAVNRGAKSVAFTTFRTCTHSPCERIL